MGILKKIIKINRFQEYLKGELIGQRPCDTAKQEPSLAERSR